MGCLFCPRYTQNRIVTVTQASIRRQVRPQQYQTKLEVTPCMLKGSLALYKLGQDNLHNHLDCQTGQRFENAWDGLDLVGHDLA